MEKLNYRQKKIRSLKLHLAITRYDLQELLLINKYGTTLQELCLRVCQLELAIKFWTLGNEKDLPTWADYF